MEKAFVSEEKIEDLYNEMEYPFKKGILILIPLQLCLFFFPVCAVVHGEALEDIVWQNIEGNHAIIHYQSLEDLKKFNSKVKYGPEHWNSAGLSSTSGSDDLAETVAKKVDAIYERVQEILGMRRKIEKPTVKIYQDRPQLDEAHAGISKGKLGFRGLRAWYVYETNTVFINANDLHAGLLAHELAHSIIDHYLLIRPPAATAEILARHVDRHLFK